MAKIKMVEIFMAKLTTAKLEMAIFKLWV
jgi:hypothetical protein